MATSAATKRRTTATTTRTKKPLAKTAAKAAEVTVKNAALHPTFNVAEVPDKGILDGYISRKVSVGGKDISEFEALDAAYKYMWNVLIEGPTGPGKTTAIQAWCALRGLRFGAVSSNAGAEPTQLFGKWNPDESGKNAFVWQDAVVTDLFRFGGVLLVNEANFLPERVATVLFGPTDNRRALTLMDHNGEVIKAHRPTVTKWIGGKYIDIPCWCDLSAKECRKRWVLIVADMNPDYEGTRPLNKAFRNRFAMQLVFDYDPEVEAQLVRSESLRNAARDLRKSDEYETPVATNMLIEFEQIAEALGVDFAITNFVNHFAADERPPAKVVIDAYKVNIEYELSEADDDDDDDDDDADDGDNDAPIEVEDEEFNWLHATGGN